MSQDRALLTRIANRDEAALAELYGAYYSRLGRFLLRVLGDEDAVIEIINDVFLVVWQSARNFRGESNPSTWILGIAYKKALKTFRKRRTTEPLDDRLVGNDRPERLAERADLDRLLQRLSPEQRAVVELTYFFGYTYREIGEILGCPQNTVKTRMFHARRSLQRYAGVDT